MRLRLLPIWPRIESVNSLSCSALSHVNGSSSAQPTLVDWRGASVTFALSNSTTRRPKTPLPPLHNQLLPHYKLFPRLLLKPLAPHNPKYNTQSAKLSPQIESLSNKSRGKIICLCSPLHTPLLFVRICPFLKRPSAGRRGLHMEVEIALLLWPGIIDA